MQQQSVDHITRKQETRTEHEESKIVRKQLALRFWSLGVVNLFASQPKHNKLSSTVAVKNNMGITLDGQVFINGTYHGSGIDLTQKPTPATVDNSPPAVTIVLAGMILVLCSLVPYLFRSRLDDTRISEQQQQQQENSANTSNQTDEEKEKQVEDLIKRHLKTHSMKLSSKNFIVRDNSKHVVSLDDSVRSSVHSGGEIVISSPKLPSNTATDALDATTTATTTRTKQPPSINQRTVPSACAICITHYKERDLVVWSSNKECIHVFHKVCINAWFMKNRRKELACPCCRQDFITVADDNITSKVTKDEQEDGSNNNDVDIETGRTAGVLAVVHNEYDAETEIAFFTIGAV